jgi:hypothetical protein
MQMDSTTNKTSELAKVFNHFADEAYVSAKKYVIEGEFTYLQVRDHLTRCMSWCGPKKREAQQHIEKHMNRAWDLPPGPEEQSDGT